LRENIVVGSQRNESDSTGQAQRPDIFVPFSKAGCIGLDYFGRSRIEDSHAYSVRNRILAGWWRLLFKLVIHEDRHYVVMAAQSHESLFGLLVPLAKVTQEKNETSGLRRGLDSI
jgi:hypothetical protein